MIIKIESYNDEDQYRMIDGVEKYVLKKKQRKPKGDFLGHTFDADLIVFDIKKTCNCNENDECNDCTYFYDIICKRPNGEEYSIYFDTIAYIMNNEGKTIEKIVANYNE